MAGAAGGEAAAGLSPDETCTAQDIERFEGTHFFAEGASLLAGGRSPRQRKRSLMQPSGSTPVGSCATPTRDAEPCAPDGNPGYHLRLVTGSGHRRLCADIGKLLGVPISNVHCIREPTGELHPKIDCNLRGDDVFLVQTMGANQSIGMDVNEAVMELLNLCHAVRLSGPNRITAVVPYFAYARQDRKTKPRVPISASAVAQLMMVMGVDRAVTVDLHSGQIQGFFHNTPVDNLPVYKEWGNYILKRVCTRERTEAASITIVAPDANGVERATKTADQIGAKVVTILQRRIEQTVGAKEAGRVSHVVETMSLVGDVSGAVCVVVDDICDTGRTVCNAVKLLQHHGAKAVYACITHGLLAADCAKRLDECAGLTELAVLDTLDAVYEARTQGRSGKLHVISCAPLLAEAIGRQHQEAPLSAVFR
eukprot:TRINITY_DN55908_c0_g1_i1.p1 TRINITY_DN55908_c0_g1~~TRINITY_DN55908_c0_g1_i1.p1  ORF type:complete len:423 (+),score=111.16 TRINITY_DN55908_c0_g1_i1:80-1348(+)